MRNEFGGEIFWNDPINICQPNMNRLIGRRSDRVSFVVAFVIDVKVICERDRFNFIAACSSMKWAEKFSALGACPFYGGA